jgi:acylphosphatase
MVVHYLVKGRVQGVGLRGWVKNTDQGHVEVVALGEDALLAEFKVALYKGSRGSRVDVVLEDELVESEGVQLGAFEIEGAW